MIRAISPSSSASLHAVQQFFIGEINDVHACSGNVRVVVEEVEDGGEGDLQSILLASGADAAVFPERFATAGMESGHPSTPLCPGTPNSSPLHA